MEAKTALELLESLFIDRGVVWGTPSETACKKGKPGSPRPGFFNFKAKKKPRCLVRGFSYAAIAMQTISLTD
jgi:hypothetical protein